jgi:hypothetical protein
MLGKNMKMFRLLDSGPKRLAVDRPSYKHMHPILLAIGQRMQMVLGLAAGPGGEV